MSLKAVFFDLDGTIAETEILHLECFNHAFREFQLPFYWDQQLYSKLLAVGGGKERIEHYFKEYVKDFSYDKELIQSLHNVKNNCYKNKLLEPLELRTGVLRLISELKQNGILIALVTTSSQYATDSFLKYSLPESISFDLVITGDNVKNKKPHPEIYQKALDHFQLNPREAVTIEDSRTGLLSAHNAGIRVLITPSLFTQDHKFDEAFSVVSDLGEPEKPFQHLMNNPLPKSYVDLEVLQYITSTQ